MLLSNEMGTTTRLIEELQAMTPQRHTKYGRQFMESYAIDKFVSIRDSAQKRHGNFEIVPSEDIGFKREGHFEKPKLSATTHRAQRIFDVLTRHLHKQKQEHDRSSPNISPKAAVNITPNTLALDLEEQGKQSGLSGTRQTPILAINKV